MTPLYVSLVLMACAALAIVAVSRVSRGWALAFGVAAYALAFALSRSIGFAAVAQGWTVMAAASAALYAVSGRSVGSVRKSGAVSGTIATFIVSLLAWPLVFPGIRVAEHDVDTVAPPTVIVANPQRLEADDDDTELPENDKTFDTPKENRTRAAQLFRAPDAGLRRDDVYARAAAFGRHNEEGARVDDSLEGLVTS